MEERNDAEYTTYLFNGKELDEETGLYYYGARYYDPRTALWLGVDSLAEKYAGWSPYNYAVDNPLRFIDPDGMGVDDFYFTQNNELVAYVENDKPDRVFVAKDDQMVYDNLNNATDQKMYDQTEMSDKEVQKLMDNNGYKKVVETEKVEVTTTTTYYTDSDGKVRTPSKDDIVNKVLDRKTKYIEKDKTLKSTKTELLLNIERKYYPDYSIETNVVKKPMTIITGIIIRMQIK